MGRECQLSWKNSQSECKAVPPKVMLGVPKGNTGFKHLITPRAEAYSPSAYTQAGVYHAGSPRPRASQLAAAHPFPTITPHYTTNQCSEAQPQGCRR